MEDILASIRRIIADDQSRHTPAFKRPASRIATVPTEPSPAPEPAHPVQVRLAADLPDAAVVPHLTPPPLPPEPEPVQVMDDADIDAIVHAGAAAVLRPTLVPLPPDPDAHGLSEPPHPVDTPSNPVAPPMQNSVLEPLVSPSTAAGIESSFQALATSVFLQNTDMVEGMMRDMLRPMLKTWLDDNLPTIVERLVRVEIERVARGGRT